MPKQLNSIQDVVELLKSLEVDSSIDYKALKDCIAALDGFCATIITAELETHAELQTPLTFPVRRIHLSYDASTYTDIGFIQPAGVGFDLDEQNEIIEKYAEKFEKVSDEDDED